MKETILLKIGLMMHRGSDLPKEMLLVSSSSTPPKQYAAAASSRKRPLQSTSSSRSQKLKRPKPVPTPSASLVSLLKTDKSVFDYFKSLQEYHTYEVEYWKNEAEYWKRMKIGNNKTGGTKRKSQIQQQVGWVLGG